MAHSAETVFRIRIFEREELEKERRLNRIRKEIDQRQAAVRRIEALKPELNEAAKKALKRLRKAGWPDWQGGELRQATDKSGKTEERAVWRLVELGEIHAFLGSDGKIYGGTPRVTEPLVQLLKWESPSELERVINRVNKLETKEEG